MTSTRHHFRPSHARSITALAAAPLLVLGLAACGTDSKTESSGTSSASESSASSASSTSGASTSASAAPDAAKLVQESARTTETLQSLHLALTATDLPKLPVESVNADVTNQPVGNGQAVGDAKFRATPNAPFVETEFLVTNKTFYTKGEDGKFTSVGPAEKIYDPAIILDKDKGLAYVIKSVQDPKVEGKEDVEGVASVEVSGTIDAAIIDPIVPTLGEGGGILPVTLFIADVAPEAAPTTTLPSDAPSPGNGPNLVRLVVEKGDGSVDVTLSKWAEPVVIPNPAG